MIATPATPSPDTILDMGREQIAPDIAAAHAARATESKRCVADQVEDVRARIIQAAEAMKKAKQELAKKAECLRVAANT